MPAIAKVCTVTDGQGRTENNTPGVLPLDLSSKQAQDVTLPG